MFELSGRASEWAAEIRARLGRLELPPVREAEIVEELAQHLGDRYAELRAAGEPPEEARRAALAELDGDLAGGLARVELPARPDPPAPERAAWGGIFGGLGADLRHALRALRRSPGTTAVALLTLALGIGAGAVVFSAVHAVLLRPLPYAEPERLVEFWLTAPAKGLPVVDLPEALYVHLRDRSRAFETIAIYTGTGFNLAGGDDAERLLGTNVAGEFFDVLGARPLHGRTFRPEEETPGNNLVAILGHGLWQRRFGGDPAILGRAIDLDGLPTVVVGIMPPGFHFPDRTELWVPIGVDPDSVDCWCYSALGRLAPGATAADAAREIGRLADDFRKLREPAAAAGELSLAVTVPLASRLTGEVRAPLLVLLGAVGTVLLIACANLGNLLLARSAARSREFAVRCSLGAGPWRIARRLLVESMLLGLAGAAAGLLLAAWGARAVEPVVLERLPHLEGIALDRTVLTFAIAAALATALGSGLAPALGAARVPVGSVLKAGARGTASRGDRRLAHAFVVAQFALSLVLLAATGLLIESFRHLLAVDPGFRAENVLAARLSLPYDRHPDPAAFHDRLLERLRTLPGVEAAAITQTAPFGRGDHQHEFVVEGREPGPGEPIPVASIRPVSPDYFAAVGTRLLAGRAFTAGDGAAAPPVAVVDQSLARRYWPDGEAVGRRIRHGDVANNPWLTIVGVAAPIKHRRLDGPTAPYIYRPHGQDPRWGVDLVVRTAQPAAAIVPLLRSELRALDPTVPLYDLRSLADAVGRSVSTRRLTNRLLAGFAAAALVLAALGIYGVTALAVAGRRHEFGIRIALGAVPAAVARLVLYRGLRLALPGVLLGLLGAAWVGRLLASLLFAVAPLEPRVLAVVTAVLVATALVACALPARRATRADPLAALREE